jgi:hypothetical protein
VVAGRKVLCSALASFFTATDRSFMSHRPDSLAETQTYILSSSLLIEAPTSAHISEVAKESKVKRSMIFLHRTTDSQNLRCVIFKIIWSIHHEIHKFMNNILVIALQQPLL